MHRGAEPSRLQSLALQLADKVGHIDKSRVYTVPVAKLAMATGRAVSINLH